MMLQSATLSSKVQLVIALLVSTFLCVLVTDYAFDVPMPVWGILLAVLFSLIISVMSVKAAGGVAEVPVSGIYESSCSTRYMS